MALVKLNKKGIFFTMMAIALLSLFIISYSTYSVFQGREAISKRIKTMNDFIFLVEEDLSRQLYISGFRIIFLFENRIIETGEYIDDVNFSFQESLYNGTLYGVEKEIMQGVTMDGIADSLNEKALKINANVSLIDTSVEIMQEDAWNVLLKFEGTLLVQDKGGLVLWNKTHQDFLYIPVENFKDPLYLVNTYGHMSHDINKTPYEVFVSGNNVSNLSAHLMNFYYRESSSAPSFLKRLEGDISADVNGIESFVYVPNLPSGVSVLQKSDLDYIYFSANNPSSYKIQGMPSWFELDDDALVRYGAEGLKIV
ncbi:hypothetical protein HOE04_03470 [archaeon]|jgi:hypothetical protein|nr:hypothetical protein [archaeon]